MIGSSTTPQTTEEAKDDRCLYCQGQGKHRCANPACIIVLMQSLRFNGIHVIANHIVAALDVTQRLGLPPPEVRVTGSLIARTAFVFNEFNMSEVNMIDNKHGNVSHNTTTSGANSPAIGAGASGTQQVTLGGTATIGGSGVNPDDGVSEQEFAEILHSVLDRHDELAQRVAEFEEREKAREDTGATKLRELSAEMAEIWKFLAQTAKGNRDAIESKVRGLGPKARQLLLDILGTVVSGVVKGVSP